MSLSTQITFYDKHRTEDKKFFMVHPCVKSTDLAERRITQSIISLLMIMHATEYECAGKAQIFFGLADFHKYL